MENAGRPLALGGFEGEEVFIHSTAQIDTPVSIGTGTRIWHFSHILPHSHIGRGCNIGQNVVIGPRVTIGNNVKIQNNISVYEGVELEDDVFCGPSCIFTNVLNPRSHISRKHEFRRTLVKQGATIGAGATIICGHTIGRHAFLAAGAVVTRNVPDYALVMGNPARITGWMCKCGVRLTFSGDEAVCSACAARYRKSGEEVSPV